MKWPSSLKAPIPPPAKSRSWASGRLQKLHGTSEAELAVLVSDKFQGKGLGPELVKKLVEVARRERVENIKADVLADNTLMQRVLTKAGFKMHREIGDPTVSANLPL